MDAGRDVRAAGGGDPVAGRGAAAGRGPAFGRGCVAGGDGPQRRDPRQGDAAEIPAAHDGDGRCGRAAGAVHRPERWRGRADAGTRAGAGRGRSEEHTSELQSLMRISYAVFCLKQKKTDNYHATLLTHSLSTTTYSN